MALHNPAYVAAETLPMSRFVKQHTVDHHVMVAGPFDRPLGVTHEGSREAPIPGISPVAAIAGESVRIYGEGETCEVVAGEALAVPGFVRPGAAGVAMKAVHGFPFGGRLLASAASGENARVQLEPGIYDNSGTVITKTADYTVLLTDLGATLTNTGAGGAVTFALPAALPGFEVRARVDAAQQLRLDPNLNEQICLPSTGVPGAAGKYLWADAVAETVHLRCSKAGIWEVFGFTGSWTAEG